MRSSPKRLEHPGLIQLDIPNIQIGASDPYFMPHRFDQRHKQIADVLGTTERTIRAQRAQLMHKMGGQSAVELGRPPEWLGEFFQAAPALDIARRQST